MKKFLLSICAALLSTSAFATTWAVVGAYTDPNWNFDASTKLTGTGDELSCTIDNLIGDFKIVDIDDSSWAIQYGTSTPVVPGTTYTLQAKNGGPDPSNIKFGDNILSIKNATVTWNPSTAALKITASDADITRGFPILYVTGSFCSWAAPGNDGTVLCTQNNGIYTATVDLGTSGNVEFKLAGSGWSNEIAGGVTVTADAGAAVTQGGDNLKTTLTGTQTLTFNANTMVMTFGDVSLTYTEPEKTWAVVGAYSDWKFEESTVFTGSGNDLSCTIDKLTSSFKIVDITNNSWDIQYGTATPIEINKSYVLDGKNGGADPSNISFANLVQSVSNATVKWNPSTFTLEIVATDADLEIAYPTLYATGSFCGWNAPGEGASVICQEEDGLYTVTIDLGEDNSDNNGQFKLAGTGWSNEIAGGVEIGLEKTTVTLGGDNLWTSLRGTQTLKFDYTTMQMWFVDSTTGVNVVGEEFATPVYFNLQGVRVDNPERGIFIKVVDGKATKVVK